MPRRRSAKRSAKRSTKRSAKRSVRRSVRRRSARRSAKRSTQCRGWKWPWAFGEFPGDRPNRPWEMNWDAYSPKAAEIDARLHAWEEAAKAAKINARSSLNAKPPAGLRPPLKSTWPQLAKDRAARNEMAEARRREERNMAGKKSWWKKIM